MQKENDLVFSNISISPIQWIGKQFLKLFAIRLGKK